MINNDNIKNKISPLDFFCIGFGSIIGVGWVVSINEWMVTSGGSLPASLGYIIALVLMVPVALCYSELASMIPVAGGCMAYCYRAMNQQVAFIAGWATFGAFVTIIPWEAIYVVDVLGIILPAIKGPELYILAGTSIHLGHVILGNIFSTILFLVNLYSVGSSARMQRFCTLFLITVGVMTMILGLIKFDINNFKPFYENMGKGSHKSFFGGSIAILASAPFFLSGFETIPQGIEDASENIASVGKTVVLSVSAACIFYALMLFCIGGAIPLQQFSTFDTPATSVLFTKLYEGTVGWIAYYIIIIGALCGLFTTWNGFMMASPRLFMSMARGYMVPHIFAKQHHTYGTPVNSLILCYVISLVGPFLGKGLIDALTSFSAAGFVLSWILSSFCVVKLRKSEPHAHRPYKLPGGSVTALFAGIVMLVIFVLLFVPGNPVFMGDMAVKLFFVWMSLGGITYMATYRSRNRISAEERKKAVLANAEDIKKNAKIHSKGDEFRISNC